MTLILTFLQGLRVLDNSQTNQTFRSQLQRYKILSSAHAEDKTELLRIYEELKTLLCENGRDKIVLQVEDQFAPSNKWLHLILHTIFLHGTVGGYVMTILPHLLRPCTLSLTTVGGAFCIYLLPLTVAAPYFFYKIFSDIHQAERNLRIKELILITELVLISEDKGEKIHLDSLYQELKALPPSRRQNKFFNRTNIETVYLTGCLLQLGASLLFTFSIGTPLGWGVVAAVTLFSGLLYAHHHHKTIVEQIAKEKKILKLEQMISEKNNFTEMKSGLFSKRTNEFEILPFIRGELNEVTSLKF